MIDTDKYEGRKPAPWVWDINGVGQYESLRCNELEDYSDETKRTIASKVGAYDVPTAELMADAPLLLAEVKRLREELAMRIALITEVDTMIGAKWNVTQDDWNELVNKHYGED